MAIEMHWLNFSAFNIKWSEGEITSVALALRLFIFPAAKAMQGAVFLR